MDMPALGNDMVKVAKAQQSRVAIGTMMLPRREFAPREGSQQQNLDPVNLGCSPRVQQCLLLEPAVDSDSKTRDFKEGEVYLSADSLSTAGLEIHPEIQISSFGNKTGSATPCSTSSKDR
ncbi:hypothetical protein WISP_02705 [Willisornis vidua]|uniref:Uncharacterized protein n=1 Tax=Willisornis vidua TaxID=1566151 RepID=A0ABQ9DZJ3_9PASS|nr:hypothetical protein WISP_02705 [Willisornis vidua]